MFYSTTVEASTHHYWKQEYPILMYLFKQKYLDVCISLVMALTEAYISVT